MSKQRNLCDYCLEEYEPKKVNQKYCSRTCVYNARRGQPAWNSGTSKGWIDKRGYRWVYITEDGRRRARREHRVIMEKQLGRRLEPWEIVHHVDGDISNNEVNNLVLMEINLHNILHNKDTRRSDNAKRSMAVHARMREEIKHLRRVNKSLTEINAQLLEACQISQRKFEYLINNYQLRASIEHEVRNIVDQLDAAIAAATGDDKDNE